MKLTDFGLARLFGSPEAGRYTHQVLAYSSALSRALSGSSALCRMADMSCNCILKQPACMAHQILRHFGSASFVNGYTMWLTSVMRSLSRQLISRCSAQLLCCCRCSRGGIGRQSSCLGAPVTGLPVTCGQLAASLQVPPAPLFDLTVVYSAVAVVMPA